MACLCIVLCGCGPSKSELDRKAAQVAADARLEAATVASNKVAIVDVLRLGMAAEARATHPAGKRGNAILHKVEFVNGLHEIPTTNCPQPFRVVWLDYVQTWERASKGGAGLGSTVEFGAGAVHANATAMADASKKLSAIDTEEALRRVETVCLTYGIGR